MNSQSNLKHGEKINIYIDIFGEIISNNYRIVTDFSISYSEDLETTERKNITINEYVNSNKKIESHIKKQISKIENIEALSASLFVYRAFMKKKMYEDMNMWTIRFKIYNTLFFLVKDSLKQSEVDCFVNEYEVLREMVDCIYTLFDNQNYFNTLNVSKQYVEKYHDRLRQISSRAGDMHSYTIQSDSLIKYLESRELTVDYLKERSLTHIGDRFMTKEQIRSDISWDNIVQRFNISHAEDDIIIICRNNYELLNEQLLIFMNTFEASKCRSSYEPENELIFTFITPRYVYISKKILEDTQTMFEDFLVWGQYENLSEYYFNKKIDQEILKKYNSLMTYKVVDILSNAGYILPLEKKNRLNIPRIELMNYTNDESLSRSLGDIDVMFYSENTKILYLIEYKNYQMMVSRQGDLSSEVSKVARENTIQKVLRRQEQVEKYINQNMLKFFSCNYEVLLVKSIILTTKPNFYFYINFHDELLYMDWIEFEGNVIESKL